MLKKFIAITALFAMFTMTGCSWGAEDTKVAGDNEPLITDEDTPENPMDVVAEDVAPEGEEVAEEVEEDVAPEDAPAMPGSDIADEQDYRDAQAELLEPTSPIIPEDIDVEIAVPAIAPLEMETSAPVDMDGEMVEAASAEVILAQCMTAAGAKLYTASWCGHCQNQKAAFADGLEFLDHTECAVAEGWAQECKDAGIESVPTWVFADGSKKSGNTPLATLAGLTGCTYQ